ncbi:hypothetical protein GCM10007036_20840 [Alsobacter metallidurans]|uniref:Uncharacterized protein n=1 Tax=Alsobacter metallidurans TaxID=340221 RepID=A0A917I841_9HYPH|nr:hypothetical protein [Alsobacter metallidurans]GGH18550.1 hypothetical protein GCM10007036_20840 [Alsobacter metallidurans]
MLSPDAIDRDAPIGAARLRNSGPRKAPLARKKRKGAWKPFVGAAVIALMAAGLATVIVQALAPGDADRSASYRQAAAPVSQPQPAEVAPAPKPSSVAALPQTTSPTPADQMAAPAAPPAAAVPEPAAPPVASVVAPPEPASPALPTPAPMTADQKAGAEAVGALATGSLNLSTQELLSSLERGEARLKAGDIASARRYFERVALAGDARGATAMGRTFDPEVLSKLPVIGLEPDAAAAATWYDKARTLKAGP